MNYFDVCNILQGILFFMSVQLFMNHVICIALLKREPKFFKALWFLFRLPHHCLILYYLTLLKPLSLPECSPLTSKTVWC